jgi:hypothetical protein
LDDFKNSAYLGIAGSLVSLVAGYLVIRIVSAISDAQSNKRQQLRRDAHAGAPPPPAQDIELPGI